MFAYYHTHLSYGLNQGGGNGFIFFIINRSFGVLLFVSPSKVSKDLGSKTAETKESLQVLLWKRLLITIRALLHLQKLKTFIDTVFLDANTASEIFWDYIKSIFQSDIPESGCHVWIIYWWSAFIVYLAALIRVQTACFVL